MQVHQNQDKNTRLNILPMNSTSTSIKLDQGHQTQRRDGGGIGTQWKESICNYTGSIVVHTLGKTEKKLQIEQKIRLDIVLQYEQIFHKMHFSFVLQLHQRHHSRHHLQAQEQNNIR